MVIRSTLIVCVLIICCAEIPGFRLMSDKLHAESLETRSHSLTDAAAYFDGLRVDLVTPKAQSAHNRTDGKPLSVGRAGLTIFKPFDWYTFPGREGHFMNGLKLMWAGTCEHHCGRASILKGIQPFYAPKTKGSYGKANSKASFSPAWKNETLMCPGERFISGLKVETGGTCYQKVCRDDLTPLTGIQLVCSAPAEFKNPIAQDFKAVTLSPLKQTKVECAGGTFMRWLAVKTRGDCRGRCRADGPVMTNINFDCARM